jgi:hypothetical protein
VKGLYVLINWFYCWVSMCCHLTILYLFIFVGFHYNKLLTKVIPVVYARKYTSTKRRWVIYLYMCLSQHLFCVLHLHTSTIVVGFCNDCECKAYVDTGIGFVLSLVCKQVSFPSPLPLRCYMITISWLWCCYDLLADCAVRAEHNLNAFSFKLAACTPWVACLYLSI